MQLIYPACFYPEEEGYSVNVPDLLGCCTQGNTLEEALEMVQDAAMGWLLTAIEEKEELPTPTNIKEIKLENKNGFVSLLQLDLDAYSQKYSNMEKVNKTLSIPSWLNERAEKGKINFSKTLEQALLYKVLHKLD